MLKKKIEGGSYLEPSIQLTSITECKGSVGNIKTNMIRSLIDFKCLFLKRLKQ